MACVTFRIPSISRANFVLMYFITFSASFILSKDPILKNVSVVPTNGLPIIGALIFSPIAPVPLAPGTKALYFLKLTFFLLYKAIYCFNF